MKTLIVGKNSSIGISLVQSGLIKNHLLIDRFQLAELFTKKGNFRKFINENRIELVIYLMVDRNPPPSDVEKLSKINFKYPIAMWEVIKDLPHISFVWASSIFAKDSSMFSKHLYLHDQNLAHNYITDGKIVTPGYSRIYLSQIYGTKNFVKHQPFLYRLSSTIKNGQNIELLNGQSTKRNFINVRDVCRVLSDSKTWISKPNVSFLDKTFTTWFEIAQTFKLFYDSSSKITNSVNPDTFDSRNYVSHNLLNLSEHYKVQNIKAVIMNGEFR